jgi:flagellin
MALSINTNLSSLNSQRAVQRNKDAMSISFQRLSTGNRINSAKDDAAGLAIGERMTSQIRGLNMAVRNANDGISMAQTAEGAMGETSAMLQRIRELSVQAANDTNSTSDRLALQGEVSQLLSEIDRIATQTTFNGRTLLDGSFGTAQLQVGQGANQTMSMALDSARSYSLGATARVTGTAVTANALAAGDVTLNGISIRATAATDDTVSSVNNSFSAIAKAAAINSSSADTGVRATANATTLTDAAAVGAGAFTAGQLLINGVDIGAVTALANDADSSLRNAINAVSSRTGVTASLDATNALVLTAADGRNITIGGTDPDGAAVLDAAFVAGTTYGTVTLESDKDFTIGGANVARAGLTAGANAVNTAVNISTLNIGTRSGAQSAISLLDTAIRQISDRRSSLGAVLSRLDSAVANLSSTSENISAARSRVMDADFAQESAAFSKNQILMQASTSMLAQANASNQGVLSLLGGG